jgi:hypothetical protein
MHLCWPFAGQLRAAAPEMVQVICTSHGVMTVPLDEAPGEGKTRLACALCAAAAVALLAPSAAPLPLDLAGFAAPRGAGAAQASVRLYPPSQPRAPPALS